MASENASIDKAQNLFVKELAWMRRQPKARTTKSKSRQDDFYVIKEKAESRRKENVVELEIDMERLGSKIIELHKISKKFGRQKDFGKFQFRFSTWRVLELLVKTERENQPF